MRGGIVGQAYLAALVIQWCVLLWDEILQA